jgi:D-alanyl-D-alanine carboxypeptidase
MRPVRGLAVVKVVTLMNASEYHARQMKALLQKFAEQQQLSGGVLVACRGDLLLRESYGLANHEYEVPNTPETRFRIASITKQFTAMAILLLHIDGRLAIQDGLSQYLDNCPEHWRGITLEQLLNHSSGIPNLTELPEIQATLELPRTPQQLMASIQDRPLDFSPGTRWKYSNSGYHLLGLVIEKVSNQSYAAFLQSHIFNPLGMIGTGFEHSAMIIAQLAAGYTIVNGHYQHARRVDIASSFAAGALYSTVDDLYRWHSALQKNQLLAEELWEKLLTAAPLIDPAGSDRYGYGWVLSKVGERVSMYHNGRSPGCRCCISRFPKDDVLVVVLGNLETMFPCLLNLDLANLILGDL